MSFSFFNRSANANKPLSKKDTEIIARWAKEREDGKWFWIFKRAAAWLFIAIMLYGAANYLTPALISFDSSQIFIALFMFGGFFAGSMLEWSKMEELYQRKSFSFDETVS